MDIIKQSYTRGKKYGLRLYSQVAENTTFYHIDHLTDNRPSGGTYNIPSKEQALTIYEKVKEDYKRYDNINLIEQKVF